MSAHSTRLSTYMIGGKRLFGLILGLGIAQNLPPRWASENTFYQAAEAVEHGAFSAARLFSGAYGDYFPALTPALPPSDLPGWWENYSQYDLLREGSENFLEAYARRHEPSYKSDLAQYHAAKYAFLRGRYAEVLRLEKDLTLTTLPKSLQEEARFLIGYAAYKEGNKALAVQTLRPLTEKLGPHHDAANFYMGVIAYEQGDFSQAAKFFEAVQTRNPYRLAVPLWLAYSLGQGRAYERLAAAAERWLGMEPPPWYGDTLWPYVAVTLAQGGLCEKAAQITPAEANPLIRWWIGVCHARQGAWSEAIQAWETLTDREDSLGGWVAYGLACAYGAQKRWEEALLWAKTSVGRPGPPRDEVLWLLAQIAWQLQESDIGSAALTTYLDLPLPPQKKQEARLMLAHFWITKGKYAEALHILGNESESRFVEARQRAWILKGYADWQKSDFSSALEAFSSAAAPDGPHTPTALLWIAETYYRLSDFARAEKAYRDFLKHPASDKHPQKDFALLYLSWTLLQQNKTSEALRLTEPLQNRYPLSHPIGKTATFLTASAYFSQKKYEQALRLFQKILTADPQEVQARYYAALSLIRLERYKEAEALLASGPVEVPGADKLLLLQAELCAEWLNNPGCTQRAAEKLLHTFPNSPLVPLARARLGLALIEQGDKEGGRTYLTAVLEAHPDQPEAARLALDGLREVLTPQAYDQAYREFIQKLPKEGPTRLSFERERLEALAADKRWGTLLQEARRLRAEIPILTDALWWEAHALEMTGDTTAAIPHYETLISDPTFGQRALSRLILLAQAQSQTPKALAYQESLLVRLPASGFGYYQALLNWSALAIEIGRTDTVLTLLRKLLSDTLLPTLSHQQALLQIALAHEKISQLDSALFYLNLVPSLEKNKWAAEALYHIARLSYEKGDYTKAREAIYRLRDDYAAYPIPRANSYLILARIFIAEQKYTSARKLLENLRETAPSAEIKAAAGALLDSVPVPKPPEPSKPKTTPKKPKRP